MKRRIESYVSSGYVALGVPLIYHGCTMTKEEKPLVTDLEDKIETFVPELIWGIGAALIVKGAYNLLYSVRRGR